MRELWAVKPGSKVDVADLDPADTRGLRGGRTAADAALRSDQAALVEWQTRLWAEGKHSLLLVLQGTDASGKDGTIAHVFDGVNPQGTRVTSFKAPTAEELAHDFLWRVHRAVARAGPSWSPSKCGSFATTTSPRSRRCLRKGERGS